jgi:hypothetical protein
VVSKAEIGGPSVNPAVRPCKLVAEWATTIQQEAVRSQRDRVAQAISGDIIRQF